MIPQIFTEPCYVPIRNIVDKKKIKLTTTITATPITTTKQVEKLTAFQIWGRAKMLHNLYQFSIGST